MSSLLSIVIPVYNSQATLEELVRRINQQLPAKEDEMEIILVDDGSKDESFEVIGSLCQRNPALEKEADWLGSPNIIGIALERNFGQQNAILCGLRYAGGDHIVTMDDDLQHDPADIPRLLSELDKGYEVVYGIAQRKCHGSFRNAGTWLNDKLFNLLMRKPRHIKVSSFRVMTKDHKQAMISCRRSFVYLSAITLSLTKNIGNLPIDHQERKNGPSNYSYRKLIGLFLRLAIYYSPLGRAKYFSSKPQYVIKEVIHR